MTEGARPPASRERFAFAAAAAVLLAFAVLHQLHDARGREAVERFFTTFTLDERRPELVATARVEATADLARQVAVRAATLDVAGSTRLERLTPSERELWMRSVRELPEEVAAARELALEAVAARPGWAFHALALAELVLADEWREPAGERLAARWLAPVRLAVAWAPAVPAAYELWGAAALERWPLLGETERAEARAALERALEEDGFRRVALGAVVQVMGAEEGLALLPETPAALALAKQVLAPTAKFEEKVALERRWREAERAERERRAAEMTASLAAARADRATAAAYDFLQRYPVDLFDDAEGREQARTVLKAVGDGRPGAWRTDPRGGLVRWFLAHPPRIGSGADLPRAASGLMGVPDGTRALLHLYADDDFAWRRIVSQTDTTGSSEWTPFYVERVRRELAAGSPAEAEAALAKVSRFDREQCDVLLARRSVARAQQRGADLSALSALWPAAFPTTLDVAAWPAKGAGSLPVCVDPEWGEKARLVLTVRADEPTLAWWGWDGGREDVALVAPGETELSFPLAGLHGLRTFSLGAVVGAGVSPLRARVDAGGGETPASPAG